MTDNPDIVERLRAAIERYDEAIDRIGSCGDGNCMIKKPKGMHTNGGCRCYQDKFKAQRVMYEGQKLANAVRAALADRKDSGND